MESEKSLRMTARTALVHSVHSVEADDRLGPVVSAEYRSGCLSQLQDSLRTMAEADAQILSHLTAESLRHEV